MMKRLPLILSCLVLVALVLAVAARYGQRIDGKGAAEWLALAEDATRAVDYRATGHTLVNNRKAAFTLDQARDGRYNMEIEGSKPSILRFDGRTLQCICDGKVSSVETEAPTEKAHLSSRLTGKATIAGRAAVRLNVRSGAVLKKLTVDRKTGVILAMSTFDDGRLRSEMTVDSIAYAPVLLPPVTEAPPGGYRAIDAAGIQQLLGRPALTPTWLPRSMTAAGTYRGFCGCCQQEMVVLRYSDGAAALTLFQMRGPMCMMGKGCRMTPDGQGVIAARTVAGIAVTAVGDVKPAVVKKVLASLR